MTETTGLLVMAYGTPADLGDVERYYTNIRRGSPPPPDLLAELTQRYRAIGGRSPLAAITRAQARGLEERLGITAYLGQKHTAPFISDALAAAAAGATRLVGLVLAPHYSTMSVGDYTRRAQRAAQELSWDGSLEVISSWHLEPGYVRWLAERVTRALAEIPGEARSSTTVVFSAHSLPATILAAHDPYPDQLAATAEAVAARLRLERFTTAWQSAGRTGEAWIGPDLLDVIDGLAASDERGVVVCPCGFVADHLEVLYDVDIEAKERAAQRGLAFIRTGSPNDDPAFLDALAGVVRRRLDAGDTSACHGAGHRGGARGS